MPIFKKEKALSYFYKNLNYICKLELAELLPNFMQGTIIYFVKKFP